MSNMEAELDSILDKELAILRKRVLSLMIRREKKLARDVQRATKESCAPQRTKAQPKKTNTRERRPERRPESTSTRPTKSSKKKYRRASDSQSRSRSLSSEYSN